MIRTDLASPLLTDLAVVTRPPSRFVRLTCSGILIISCTFFGFSQCLAQDVADAARQEQARKENQQKKSKHVYTEEDLKQAQILTPEDRAEVEARKKQQPFPPVEKSEDAMDAQALPADLPLGDVARRYRRMRESLRLQESAEFHLPFVEEPVLATPKPSVIVPAKPPVIVAPKPPVMPHGAPSNPAAPQLEPFQPPVKRSPFERPRNFFSAPARVVPSNPPANHVAPPQAPAVSATPARPSTIPVTPSKPAAPAPIVRVLPMPVPAHTPRVTPEQPNAPIMHVAPSRPLAIPMTPSRPLAPASDIRVMPAPSPATRVVPAQPAAPVIGGTPAHASSISAAPSQPAAPAPGIGVMPSPSPTPRVAPVQPASPFVGTALAHPSTLGVAPSQPAAPVVPVTPSRPATVAVAPAKPVAPVAAQAILNVVAVKPGDSLWKLAEQNLGNGLRWHDLLAVNPGIVDANYIVAGSQIFLPAATPSMHAATKITVQKGDTLSQIAQSELGHASYAACITKANPGVHDANRIYASQSLVLPASCKK